MKLPPHPLEIEVRRLLHSCEAGIAAHPNSRISQYVAFLMDQIEKLHELRMKSSFEGYTKPSLETLDDFRIRGVTLTKLIDPEKIMADNSFPSFFCHNSLKSLKYAYKPGAIKPLSEKRASSVDEVLDATVDKTTDADTLGSLCTKIKEEILQSRKKELFLTEVLREEEEVVENGPDNYDGSLGFGLDPVERLLVSIENQERLEKRAEEEDRVRRRERRHARKNYDDFTDSDGDAIEDTDDDDVKDLRDLLFEGIEKTSGGDATSSSLQIRIDHERHQQELLAEELAMMSKLLRLTSEGIGETLKEDNMVLDETESIANDNQNLIGKENSRLNSTVKTTQNFNMNLCCMLLTIGLTLFVTLLLLAF